MTLSNSAISGAQSASKSIRKGPQKPATREEKIVDFARSILSRARAQLPAIQRHPTGKRQLTKARLDAFERMIRTLTTLMTAHQLQKDGTVAATATEARLRLALVAQVTEIRDSVAALASEGHDAGPAFGVGKRLSRSSNADVLLLSAAQQQAFESRQFSLIAREAGVTAHQITKLVAARRALSSAATTQATAFTTKTGQAIEKKAQLKALSKETTAIRRIACVALRGNPSALEAFARAPKTRTTKRAPRGKIAPQTGNGADASSNGANQTGAATASASGTSNSTLN